MVIQKQMTTIHIQKNKITFKIGRYIITDKNNLTMGLDITVYKILKERPKKDNDGFELDYFKLIDDEGNYKNSFPEWTKQYEHIVTEKWYDWDKYKEETGIDINQMDWHGESYGKDGCFMTVAPKDKEYPEYHEGDNWDEYQKKLNEVQIKIDLTKVPLKEKEIKVLYREEVGYQRKGLNSQFYKDYQDGKIGYYVWNKKELQRYKKDYCDKAYEYIYPSGEKSGQIIHPKLDFQRNIIDTFIEGECVTTFSW